LKTLGSKNYGATLTTGICVDKGNYMQSANGCFKLHINSTGNFIISRNSDGRELFAFDASKNSDSFCMKNDGNFATYEGKNEVWSSYTTQNNASLKLRDDGALIVSNITDGVENIEFKTDTVVPCTGKDNFQS
jgi:hypothetical protein